MSGSICEDCRRSTSGRCWRHPLVVTTGYPEYDAYPALAPMGPPHCPHCNAAGGRHLADCPTVLGAVTKGQWGPEVFEVTLPVAHPPRPTNGVHFIGWDQHARRGRPSEAEDTIERLGSW